MTKTFLLKLAIEYRLQILDQLDVMQIHGLGQSIQYHDLYTVCRDTSALIWFLRGSPNN